MTLSSRLNLCAFLVVDLRSADSTHVFNAMDCRVYRFSHTALEVIVPRGLDEDINQVFVTLNYVGLPAPDILADVVRKVGFDAYDLWCISIPEDAPSELQSVLRRIEGAVEKRRVSPVDIQVLLDSFNGLDVEIGRLNGFVFSHEHFEVRVEGRLLRTMVKRPLTLREYQIYLSLHAFLGRRLLAEHGGFDRVIDLTVMDGMRLGPLDVLLAYEISIWASVAGVQKTFLFNGKTPVEFQFAQVYDRYESFHWSPEKDENLWVFSLNSFGV